MIRVLIIMLPICAWCFYLAAPSEADLKACVENSNYTKEQCFHEINR